MTSMAFRFVNLVTASQLLNYAIISLSYIRFHKVRAVIPVPNPFIPNHILQALKVQGISRDTLPYKTRFQPFCAYYGLVCTFVMAFVGGYTVFLPGNWDVPNFIFSYGMIGILPVLFIFWKLKNRTKVCALHVLVNSTRVLMYPFQWQDLSTMTFFDKERMVIDQYEEELSQKTA